MDLYFFGLTFQKMLDNIVGMLIVTYNVVHVYKVHSKINVNASQTPLLKVLQRFKRVYLKGLNLTNKLVI